MEIQYIQDYSSWFGQFPFEAMLTVRVPKTMPLERVHGTYVREILQPLSEVIGEKVAGITVVVPEKEHKFHLHSLILSETEGVVKKQVDNIRLFFETSRNIANLNDHEKACEVSSIFYLPGVCWYVADQLKEDNSQLKFYKERLLNHRMRNINPKYKQRRIQHGS